MGQNTKTLGELAALVDGELLGDAETIIGNLNDLDQAVPGEISFLSKAKFADKISETKASAIIIPQDVTDVSLPAIRVKNPYLAAAVVNTAIEEYQAFLKAEGKQKINHQLRYLKQRQNEALEKLELLMEEQMAH